MLQWILLLILIVVAAWYDIRFSKIPNKLIVIGAVIAALLCYVKSEWLGVALGLHGLFIGFAITLILYIIKAVAAGDVKLFAVIGLIIGADLAIKLLIITILISAAVFICHVTIKAATARQFRQLILTLWYITHDPRELSTYWSTNRKVSRIPIMYAVVPAFFIICMMQIKAGG